MKTLKRYYTSKFRTIVISSWITILMIGYLWCNPLTDYDQLDMIRYAVASVFASEICLFCPWLVYHSLNNFDKQKHGSDHEKNARKACQPQAE